MEMDQQETAMQALEAEEIRRAWRAAHLSPLWESPSAHKPPREPAATHIWHWKDVRTLFDFAFQETSPAVIERRVLQLVSPLSPSADEEFTAGSVQVAIQGILPGETARPHRHTMNALRFVLEGSGAVTVVDGKSCPMSFGDLILTPAWCWHEHRHQGTEPVLWLDALDVPLHTYLGTVEFQPPPITNLPPTMDDSAFATPNILPEETIADREHSPVFRYPYADAVAALANAPPSPDRARRVRYANPLTGGPAMALLDSFLMQIQPGPETSPMRTNANAVCLVVEGHGTSRVGKNTISWGPKDVFTLPQWNWVAHSTTAGDAKLFVVSDRDVLKKLGLYRQEVQS